MYTRFEEVVKTDHRVVVDVRHDGRIADTNDIIESDVTHISVVVDFDDLLDKIRQVYAVDGSSVGDMDVCIEYHVSECFGVGNIPRRVNLYRLKERWKNTATNFACGILSDFWNISHKIDRWRS